MPTVPVQPVVPTVAAAPVITASPVEAFGATVGFTPVFSVRVRRVKAHDLRDCTSLIRSLRQSFNAYTVDVQLNPLGQPVNLGLIVRIVLQISFVKHLSPKLTA
jgi:hypothetical protein